MNHNPHTEEFLTAATAGLRHDRELQLDAQAELRSHLDERRREAEAAGLAADAAADEAVRAMGPAADIAADLERANRRRMRLRGLLRLAAQWLLAPLAVVVAVVLTDWGAFQAIRLVNVLGGNAGWMPSSTMPAMRRGLTPEQQLVLRGDTTRKTPIEQQKAIWEKWPDNKTYLHNYVTYLIQKAQNQDGTPAERYATLAAETAKLRPLDPDNARFDYILAGRLLDQAVETKTRQVKAPDGTSKSEYDMTVKDRARLDEAMALFKAGLAKPEFRRYTRELAAERMGIMGEPTSLLQQISEIAMLAGILLPDLSHLRNLERATIFYGELLAKEGRRADADIFLNAHRRFVPQLNRDSFTLIDVLVVGAIAAIAADRVPTIYETLGDTATAARVRAETAVLNAPVKEWREKMKAARDTPAGKAWEKDLKRHRGVLAGMLLPALGEYPTPAELAPSRNLEYVVAEGMALLLLSGGLTVMMLAYAFMAVYYRWTRGGGSSALILLPDAGDVLRIIGFGVLLPLLLYYVITRWLPWGGRNLSVVYGFPHFLAQYLAVFNAIVMGTTALADNCVRRRCRELLLPVAPPTRAFWFVGWGTVGVLALLGLLPDTWLDPERFYVKPLCAVTAAILVLLVVANLVYSVVCDVRFGKSCAAYYGSLARTLIPVIALTLILVSVCSRPYLRMEERRLLQNDSVMGVDRNGGFTAVESRLTQRLKSEIQKAADSLPQ